jgi:hypothetical protein
MNRIVSSLKLRMKGPEVADLQDTLQLFLEKQAMLAEDESTRRDLYAALPPERGKQTFGAATSGLVGIFQGQKRFGASGEVDEPTARAVNALLEELGAFGPAAAVNAGDKDRGEHGTRPEGANSTRTFFRF